MRLDCPVSFMVDTGLAMPVFASDGFVTLNQHVFYV